MTKTPEEMPSVEIIDMPAQKPATANLPLSPADAIAPSFFQTLPNRMRPFLSLARIDRPVGIWLLLLPCWIGIAFSAIPTGFALIYLVWFVVFAIGAVAMRGAGCTWNDISDRKYDGAVARTANRPIPSGAVSLKQAYIFLAAQLLIGFLVWLTLPVDAKIIALLAIPLVAAYPFMKRITFWPQAWLGLTFNWGVLVAAATIGSVGFPSLVLFFALALWTISYDTVYALQDREDDALIGVKSTARLFGKNAVLWACVFYIAAAALLAIAAYLNGAGRMGALAALGFLAHGLWQTASLKRHRETNALAIFKSNVWAATIVLVCFEIAVLF